MRLFLCLALLALLPPPLATAQNQFGARLGLTAATVTGDFATADAASTRVGFVGGFYLAFPLRYDLAVQAEVLYTQKGFETDEATVLGGDGLPLPASSATFELTTLDVPVLLKYTASVTPDLEVAPYAGPYASFELFERLSADTSDGPVSEETDLFKSTDLGLVVGLDLRIQIAGFAPSLGVRYSRSAVNLLEEDASQVPDATAYNSVLLFFLGLHL